MHARASARVVPLRSPQEPEIAEARRVLREQSELLLQLANRIDAAYSRAVDVLFATRSRVVVVGVGKSGIIARKIAATLSSTGTPATFVNAAEAHHGDLGMITADDTALVLSRSGETDEVVRLLPHLRQLGVPVVALVGELESTLAHLADVVLDVSVDREVCPNNLAPTSSTLAALAIGDALAVSLSRRRHFTAEDFARLHPGGRLGHDLTVRVREVMRRNDLPVVDAADSVGDALIRMTGGRLGLVLVLSAGKLVGIVTDGDLRRGMQRHANLLRQPIAEIMTTAPVTVDESAQLATAHQRMKALKIKALVVVDAEDRVTGIVEVFDER